jgi:hypothetical protein
MCSDIVMRGQPLYQVTGKHHIPLCSLISYAKQNAANIIYMLKSDLLAAELTCPEPAVVVMTQKVMLMGYAVSYSSFELTWGVFGKCLKRLEDEGNW